VSVTIHEGDSRAVLATLPEKSARCCVTSPPYFGLRDYGNAAQMGLERTPDEYVAGMVALFREVRRVLTDDGTLWLNLGDSYSGSANSGGVNPTRIDARGIVSGESVRVTGLPSKGGDGIKPKDLLGIPWRVAFALQADGWYLRSDIIWAKPNSMPESVTDRPTKAHEYLFLLAKSPRYYYNADAVREPHQHPEVSHKSTRSPAGADEAFMGNAPTNLGRAGNHPAGRNLRSVWTVATQPYPGAHFATFPRKLVEPCVKAGSPEGGLVLDPFAGSGTTLLVAQSLSRRAIGIDLNPEYLAQALARNAQSPLGLEALHAALAAPATEEPR
jgi:DNA modification methylase